MRDSDLAILCEIRQLESAIARKKRLIPEVSAIRIRELRQDIYLLEKQIEELVDRMRERKVE